MLNRIILTSVFAIGAAWPSVISAQAPPKGSGHVEITGPVRVIDGDTIEVYINGRQTGIGIIGVRVPRANSRCGRQAAEFTQELINGFTLEKKIKLRFEEDDDDAFDGRKRRKYYLKLPGGVSAALELVRAGLAEPDGTGKEKDQLDAAARQVPKCID
jgi:endonuclease YncB( thermonuclease family)